MPSGLPLSALPPERRRDSKSENIDYFITKTPASPERPILSRSFPRGCGRERYPLVKMNRGCDLVSEREGKFPAGRAVVILLPMRHWVRGGAFSLSDCSRCKGGVVQSLTREDAVLFEVYGRRYCAVAGITGYRSRGRARALAGGNGAKRVRGSDLADSYGPRPSHVRETLGVLAVAPLWPTQIERSQPAEMPSPRLPGR